MSIEYMIKLSVDVLSSSAAVLLLWIMRSILRKENFVNKKLIMLFTSVLISILLLNIWSDYAFVMYRYWFPAEASSLITNETMSKP